MENRADGAHREREHFFGAAKSVRLTELSGEETVGPLGPTKRRLSEYWG